MISALAFGIILALQQLRRKTSLLLLAIEDIANVLGEVAGVDMLVGLRGGLWVFMTEGALGGSRAALAVEDIADAAACAVGLEVVDRTIGIDPRFVAQVVENPTHASGGKIRRCDLIVTQERFDIALFEECFDLFGFNALFREVFSRETIERGCVCGREDWPVLSGRVLDLAVAVESGSSLTRELGLLPLLVFPEDAERATIKIDIVPAKALSANILWITDDLADATAAKGEDSNERAVAHFDGGFRATLVDGVVGAFVNVQRFGV